MIETLDTLLLTCDCVSVYVPVLCVLMTHTSFICSLHLIPALLAQEQITDSRCDESRAGEPDTHLLTHTHTPPLLIMTEQCSHFLTALFVLSYHLCSGYCLLLKTFLCLMVNICDVNFMIFVYVCSQAEQIQRLEEEVSRLKSQHSSVSQQVTAGLCYSHFYF